MNKIQVGFLVSYDYELLKNSLPRVYEDADTIFLAIDINRKTWKGDTFEIQPNFFKWIKTIDIQSKIVIYEDDFYISDLTSMQCEIRERKMLSKKMGIGNWLIQLDADEYFLNFKNYIKYLRKYDRFLIHPEKKQIQIAGFLINMYKFTDDGLLFVKKPTRVLAATNYPSYKVGRQTKQRIIYTTNILWHETLSRDEKSLEYKLKNWGHDCDIDLKGFMDKWRTVNSSNYTTMRNFFFMNPKKWKELQFVTGENMEEVSRNLDPNKYLPSSFYIAFKNFEQWFKFLFRNRK